MGNLKEHLLQVSSVFNRVHQEHQNFKARLNEIEKSSHLTPSEQIEVKQIKKQKLHLKDRMTQMARTYEETGKVPEEQTEE